jgi:hypothetical protein
LLLYSSNLLGVSNWPVIYFINYTPTSSLALFNTAPSTPYSIHLRGTKMYQDLKEQFGWCGMKREIAFYIARCDVCQRVKAKHE